MISDKLFIKPFAGERKGRRYALRFYSKTDHCYLPLSEIKVFYPNVEWDFSKIDQDKHAFLVLLSILKSLEGSEAGEVSFLNRVIRKGGFLNYIKSLERSNA